MSDTAHKETLGFQAEVQQLLKLMIHSLYSNKEIFLRELISNAADALDKLRFEALSNDGLYENDGDLKIRVDFDKDNRTVIVSDNGIGMTREDVVSHIGTIAKSGTKEFLQNLSGDQSKDANLIGQFGVGFYSSFIVADAVTLLTRRAGEAVDNGVRWHSKGDGQFDVEYVAKPDRGTQVILHLREGEDEFLEDYRLRSIIHKYSDHVPVPIIMKKRPSDQAEAGAGAEAGADESAKAEPEAEVVNKATALWVRSKNDISEEEYKEFYKHVAHDFTDPLLHLHSRVEGTQEYILLLYIPSRAPFDLWDREHQHGVKLYVKRVFIMDDAEKLMPKYLRFVRGVIDSSDLPLNVSREILQNNKMIDTIRAGSVKKILDQLQSTADKDAETYKTFWNEFGSVLKEGVIEDHTNKEKIAKLLRFASTHDREGHTTVSLDDYISRMKPDQEPIYFITGDNYTAASNSPHLELLTDKGVEVLVLTDRVDEWMVTYLTEYDGKQLKSITKGDLDVEKLVDEKQQDEIKRSSDKHKDLLEKLKTNLQSKVKDVKVSARLTSSPACLIADNQDISLQLEKMLKEAGQAVPDSKPILEINLQHPIVEKIEGEQDETRFRDWVEVLFDQAVLSGGGQLDDPAGFVKKLNELLLEMTDRKIILP